MHWVKRGRALSSCWKLGFSGVSAAYKCKHFFSIEMGKSQRTWGGLEPTRWPSSWCAYLWWSNNQPDEPSVSLGTPVSWKTGERQMFSTTEQSQAVIHSTNPAHDFLVIWQPQKGMLSSFPSAPPWSWLWQQWHSWAEGRLSWLLQEKPLQVCDSWEGLLRDVWGRMWNATPGMGGVLI